MEEIIFGSLPKENRALTIVTNETEAVRHTKTR